MKVTGEETLWAGKFLKAVLITYADDRGRTRTWEAVGRVGCDGVVVVVPITAEGELVLIRQFRPALNRLVVELPAGLVNPGEEPLEAARRELVEETGYYSEALAPVTEGVMSTGINTEIWNVFLARDARPAPPEMRSLYPPDESEEIEVMKVALDAVYDTAESCKKRGDLMDLRIFGIVELAGRMLSSGQ